MANRTIPFGYAVENGKTTVSENEAKIVRYIYAAYADGKILREIAEELTARQVVFHEDKVVWNKNMIARMIEDRRYIGEKGYPAIVNIDLFTKVNDKKTEKGFKKDKHSDVIEYLKNILYCHQCGTHLERRNSEGERERWRCPKHCKCGIASSMVLDGINKVLQMAKMTPELLHVETAESTYFRTQEIGRYINEIGRMFNEPSPSFPAGKKLILECAAKKFCACTENVAISYTDFLLQEIMQTNESAYLTCAFLKKTVDKIRVREDGRVIVRFINGAEVASTERRENANAE